MTTIENATPPESEADDAPKSPKSPKSPTRDFAPAVALPEPVPVVTNEEDEEVMLRARARLYRFDRDRGSGAEWVERGTGELRLLRHPTAHTVRVVMRRDKTFKVCANHFVTPAMRLAPCVGADGKAYSYVTHGDYSLERLRAECFALKFRSAEAAREFRAKFEEARETVRDKCALYAEAKQDSDHNDTDEGDTDEVIKKFDDLNVDKE